MIFHAFSCCQEDKLLANRNNPVGGFGGFHSHTSFGNDNYVAGVGFGGVSFQDFFLAGF